jgi:hypothetical protein
MQRQVDPKAAQAAERCGDCLLDLGLHDLELDLQMVDGGLIDPSRCARQQQCNQLPGLVGVAAQKLALHTFQP